MFLLCSALAFAAPLTAGEAVAADVRLAWAAAAVTREQPRVARIAAQEARAVRDVMPRGRLSRSSPNSGVDAAPRPD